MGLARRQEIVAIAQRYDLQIIEDDCYAPAMPDLPALRAMAPERVHESPENFLPHLLLLIVRLVEFLDIERDSYWL